METEEPRHETTLTRRGFLGWMLGLGSGIVVLVSGLPVLGALLGQPPRAAQADFVEVAPISDLPAGEPVGLTFTAEGRDAFEVSVLPHHIWVVADGSGGVTVLSPVCTHLGCQVFWESAGQHFVCPCHGSVFSKDGSVIRGPAPRHLDVLPSKVKDGVLSVRWVDYVPGTAAKTPV